MRRQETSALRCTNLCSLNAAWCCNPSGSGGNSSSRHSSLGSSVHVSTPFLQNKKLEKKKTSNGRQGNNAQVYAGPPSQHIPRKPAQRPKLYIHKKKPLEEMVNRIKGRKTFTTTLGSCDRQQQTPPLRTTTTVRSSTEEMVLKTGAADIV